MNSISNMRYEEWLESLPIDSKETKSINQIESEAIKEAGITDNQFMILEEAYNTMLLIAQERAYKDGYEQSRRDALSVID